METEPQIQAEPTSEPSSQHEPTNELDIQLDQIQQNLTKLKTGIAAIQSQIRVLEKTVKKESKAMKLRQPKIIGFDIPEKIKPELAAFMNLPPEDCKSTRTAVTTYISEYIRQNKLQDMTDRKKIKLNDALATLFLITEDSPLTYYNLHKYINSLFIKK